MPMTTTSTELQRNYKNVVRMVKKSKEPVAVLSNNKPEMVIMDYQVFADYSKNIVSKNPRRRKGLNELFGSWSDKEAEEFDKVIEDAFEQVNPDGWK